MFVQTFSVGSWWPSEAPWPTRAQLQPSCQPWWKVLLNGCWLHACWKFTVKCEKVWCLHRALKQWIFVWMTWIFFWWDRVNRGTIRKSLRGVPLKGKEGQASMYRSCFFAPAVCVLAVRETARYMCICSNNHFGTNPEYLIIWNVAEPCQMKCCGAVPNEMLRSHPKWNVAEPSQMECCGAVLKWND